MTEKTGHSPIPTSNVVSPRSSMKFEKTIPNKNQIQSVTGQKPARPKTSLESRLMNVVATPNTKRNETSNCKSTTSNKTTLAQIMSLNSNRNKASRTNTLKVNKREFAQTMIVPAPRTNSQSRTAKDKSSNKL